MAPITRSSLHGAPAAAANARDSRSNSHPGSFEAEDESMIDDYAGGDEYADEDQESPYRSSAQEILRPLQATADRVTKQAEEFAKALDKFVTTRKPSDQRLWDDALVLLGAYSTIGAKRRQKTSTTDPDAEVQKIQLEADLWVLVRNLLELESPHEKRETITSRETGLSNLHRYSSSVDVWQTFLNSDSVAQDYECILDWLHQREVTTGADFDDIVRILNERSDRGEGVWSAGPMYTQAAVKKQKRSRQLSTPLEPSTLGPESGHTRQPGGSPLVAQLDPDAQTREHGVLQVQDEYHEQAAWRTYWEMLRRGYTPLQVQAWWAERKENWRSAILFGTGIDASKMGISPWLRMINIASNPGWFDRCEALSQDPSLDEYQRAVCGIVAGNATSAGSVSQTIDDHLFAIFNALLIDRYRIYLQAYDHKLKNPSETTYQPPVASNASLQNFSIEALASEEIRQSHKFLQLAIVSKNFKGFLLDVGQAVAQTAHKHGYGSHLIKNATGEENEVPQLNLQDPDTVRFVAHLQLALQSLGLLQSSFAEHEYEMENNIANYIAWLEVQGQFSLIPLYVSKLSKLRGEHVLASILVNITDPRERELQVKLIKQYDLDISAIAYGVFTLANFDSIQKLRSADGPPESPRITEPGAANKAGQLRIKRHLMSGEVSDEEERAIRSVEWYRFVDADRWGSAAWSVSLLYKIFLYEGRFAALRSLLTRVSLGDVSLAAVGMNLNYADEEPQAEKPLTPDEEMDEDHFLSMSPSRRRKPSAQDHILTRTGTDRATLALKSRIWQELEQLVAAIDALEGFQDLVDDLDENRANPSYVRTMKRELRNALDVVRETMQPLLAYEYLCQPQDEMEGVLLRDLRNHYIPDCVLAYNGTLYFAGHSLSRAYLVECMELAQIVAQNPMLTEAFVQSQRMKELVRAFALDSQALLLANEQGGNKAKRTKTEKGNSDIWNVTWKDQGDVDLEALD